MILMTMMTMAGTDTGFQQDSSRHETEDFGNGISNILRPLQAMTLVRVELVRFPTLF